MDLLLCILLHLSIIVSPGIYTEAEINTFEQDNLVEVDLIRNDQAASQQVLADFTSELQWITIVDPGEQ